MDPWVYSPMNSALLAHHTLAPRSTKGLGSHRMGQLSIFPLLKDLWISGTTSTNKESQRWRTQGVCQHSSEITYTFTAHNAMEPISSGLRHGAAHLQSSLEVYGQEDARPPARPPALPGLAQQKNQVDCNVSKRGSSRSSIVFLEAGYSSKYHAPLDFFVIH